MMWMCMLGYRRGLPLLHRFCSERKLRRITKTIQPHVPTSPSLSSSRFRFFFFFLASSARLLS